MIRRLGCAAMVLALACDPPSPGSTSASSTAKKTAAPPLASASSTPSVAPRPPITSFPVPQDTKYMAPSKDYHGSHGGYSMQFFAAPEVTERPTTDGPTTAITVAAIATDSNHMQSSACIEVHNAPMYDCNLSMAAPLSGLSNMGCKFDDMPSAPLGTMPTRQVKFQCPDGVRGLRREICDLRVKDQQIIVYDNEALYVPGHFNEVEAKAFLDSFKIEAAAKPKP